MARGRNVNFQSIALGEFELSVFRDMKLNVSFRGYEAACVLRWRSWVVM